MYWLITAYDVLDQLHLRVRCVAEEDESHGLDPAFVRNAVVALGDGLAPTTDGFKYLLNELADLAYYSQED